MNTSYLFIVGCSGSGSPPSGKISFPSAATHSPLVVPVTRREFGGLTSSLGILCGDIGFFIDNGTGVQHVAEFLTKGDAKFILGLQTHFHADHMAGIYTNPLLFSKSCVSQVLAPKLHGRSFEEIVRADFRSDAWPVSPEKLGVTLPIQEFDPGAVLPLFRSTRTLSLNHPGGAVAYRINLPRGDVVIATDHELNAENESEYGEFVSGAHTLYSMLMFNIVT